MKILLDENLPHQLRHEITGHDVFTVTFMKWNGISNGRLLALAASEKFDVFITNDQEIPYQQNLSALPIAVIVLIAPSNTIEVIREFVPSILSALEKTEPGQLVRVESPSI